MIFEFHQNDFSIGFISTGKPFRSSVSGTFEGLDFLIGNGLTAKPEPDAESA